LITVEANRLDQRFYVLTLNFEIPQVAYFQFLVIFLRKYLIIFPHENIKKLASKVADLWQFGFFSLQPRLPKMAQN
jgi:hypothetical protein